ncbi:TylF/MycF/NovP-related O-methyltransferase [Muricoccus radiodurans]|uniref:TylF/MycF/NovP-related O-methyltransferase n=1 Tax=Muricoccus radiodurans TaxID=2231721 RepID=UPI003CF120A9
MSGPAQFASVDLYLDLLKRCLTDLIHAEHPLANAVPAGTAARRPLLRRAVRLADKVAQRFGLIVAEYQRTPFASHAGLASAQVRELREVGADWPPRAHTMIGLRRLENIQSCVEAVLRDGIPGDLLEAGVWRGGASIFMRGILAAYSDMTRQVWLADSFQGLPPPDAERYPADRDFDLSTMDQLAISRSEVEANFRAYALLDERVRFLEGFFADTLPSAPVDRLSVLRLDGDLYASTMQVLEPLYDRLSPGGFVIVDDYSLPPCRAAINDFRAARGITDPIETVDWTGIFWRKA